jgi:hypothetical protein
LVAGAILMSWVRYIVLIGAVIPLAGCDRPDAQTLKVCRESAYQQGQGHQLIPSDSGELVEACMLAKGYALKETGKQCKDDFATAAGARCYYPDTFSGRLANWIGF